MGGVWIIFHQPPLRVHLIPPFIHSCQLNNDPRVGGGGPKASGGGQHPPQAASCQPLFSRLPLTNLPCFLHTLCSGKTVNESINGEPPTTLPIMKVSSSNNSLEKISNSFSLISRVLCWIWDNCGAGLIPRLWKAAVASVHRHGSEADPLLSTPIIHSYCFLRSSQAHLPVL